MKKPNNYFRNVNRIPSSQNEDQNQVKNQGNLKNNKANCIGHSSKSLQPIIKLQSNPLTSYRAVVNEQQNNEKKWQLLMKFHQLASKAHYIHHLKFQTLFLSFSLAQKTVELVLNESVEFGYWAACCLFMPMKYEEIYPPRLKDLSMLIKQAIKSSEYNSSELIIFEFINLNLNFVSINTYLSEFLHASNEHQKYFIFYFLQIALSLRLQLKNFSLKEIVLSVIYILSSHRLHFYMHQKIDGIQFGRIEDCSKYIILSQTSAAQRLPFLFKKYKSERMKRVSLTSIPTVQSFTALLLKKTDQEASIPKIVGLCQDLSDDTMDSQNDEDDDENDQLMQILTSRAKYQMRE